MLKRMAGILLVFILMLGVLPLNAAFAREGDSGYEGGISSGYKPGKTVSDYQEVIFLTGEPIVLKGTLTITKQKKQDSLTTTYKYSLKNTDKAAALTRTLSFMTKLTVKENGQTVEDTSFTKPPQETIKIGSTSYILQNSLSDFTRSSLVDPRPAINYYAGNLWEKKVYFIGSNGAGGSVTVESTGDYWGYDQYWGSSEIQAVRLSINCENKTGEKTDSWGGTARVTISSTTTNQLKYYENQPDQISFKGGYVKKQYNSSVLEYESSLPEFDSKGISTDRILDKSDSLKVETFPVQTMLPVVDLSSIRGHWAEQNIALMYGLEIFQGNSKLIKPDQYITKAEFALAITQAAREVPPDPMIKQSSTANKKKTAVVSPFNDVSIDNKYFSQIQSAYNRGLISGKGDNLFGPNDSITKAEAIAVFIRAVGLESLAPSPLAVTTFKDNDAIPAYARNAVYVAQKIGVVQGDSKGYLSPNKKLTKAEAASMISRLIAYLQDGIQKDYRDRIINY